MKRVILLASLLALAACGDRSGLPPVTSFSPADANDVAAGYSPDGSQVYWWSRAGDKWQLWRSAADTRAPTKMPLLAYSTQPLAWSPDGSRFAVGAAVDGPVLQLWVVDSAGTEARKVSRGDEYADPTGWNPDGKRVAYLGVLPGGQIATMAVDVDGGSPTRLVPGETRPNLAVWSPDGSLLAVQILDAGRFFISLADSDGSNLRPLTTEGFEDMQGPYGWSPDGSSILYVSTRTGAGNLWVAPVNGDSARQLTNDVRADNTAFWSPDGQWIAFQSERGQQSDIWVVPPAGGPARRVTDDVQRETLYGWRPGTEEVAYTTGRTLGTLWTHNLADGSERQLTPDSLEVAYFNLSSKGEVEVTVNRGGGVFDFTAMPLAGGDRHTILANAGGSGVRWSPDGSMLGFHSDRGGSNDIWVVDASGGPPRQLTNWPGRENDVTWSPDGSQIYFVADRDAKLGDVWRVPAGGGEPVRVTHNGNVLNLCGQNRPTSSLFVVVLGEGASTFRSARIQPDGSLRFLWDSTASFCAEASPTSDSAFVSVSGEGGAVASVLVPLTGGAGRQLLPAGQAAQEWSPDGSQLLYSFQDGSATDYGVLTMADGSTKRVTQTPENEGGAEWTADGSALLFRRAVPISRLTTANLTKLLATKE
jgi:Tol biopolymer transport system component